MGTKANRFFAIWLNSVGTVTPSEIRGNTINGFNWRNLSGYRWMGGILIDAGDVTLGVSGEPNTIGSISGTPNMTINSDDCSSIIVPIFLNGSGYITCQYNEIGGITCNNSDPITHTRFYGIYRDNRNAGGIISYNTIGSATSPVSCTSPSTNDRQYVVGIQNNSGATTGLTISNNNISYLNNSYINEGYVSGVYSNAWNAALTISDNNIHDLTSANTSTGGALTASVLGIGLSTTYLVTVTNNTIYNLSNTNTSFNGFMYGIYCTGGTGANDCSGNTIYNISATGTSAGPYIYGIYFNAGTGMENTITRNYVYGLTSAGVTGNCSYTQYYGIYKENSCVATIANNILSLVGNTMSTIYGIYEKGGAGCNTSIYFNTAYISGSPTSGNLSSYALYSANNNTRNSKNNIFMNARTNGGVKGATGKHYSAYFATNPSSTGLTQDYNDYVLSTEGNFLGYFNNADVTTLANWKTATGQDVHSKNKLVTFVSTTDLHLSGSSIGDIDLIGTPIAGITTDYFGNPRNATYPYMGGNEVSDHPLPVLLASLNSVVNGRNVRLTWITTSEINNSGFEVQRAVFGSEYLVFSKMAFVSGKGTTNTSSSYTFEDRNMQTGKYQYRLKQIDNNGNFEFHNLNGTIEVGIPNKFDLSQNYPNPFNPVTKINFDLPADSKVTLAIYDITGREIAKLLNSEFRAAGYYTMDFNGGSFASGVYFYRFIAESAGKQTVISKRMALVK